MAHGILCENCGWLESAHIDSSGLEWNVPRDGYKITLKDCTSLGFEPDNPGLAKKLQEEDPVPFGTY